MKPVYTRPKSLKRNTMHYCPGCHHSTVHKLIGEVMDEMGIQDRCVSMVGVGCGVFLYDYLEVDSVEAPHGRALAMATAVKRVRPDRVVFTYQGDGDLASIGLGETVHAANRGDSLTCFFINNTVYGMTGGQMAPTTLMGQKTTTTTAGRTELQGYPLRMVEMLAPLEGVAYAVRTTVATPKLLGDTKKAIRKAFEVQLAGGGFSIVEILASCPTNWGMDAIQANKRVQTEMMEYFPLGTYKDRSANDAA